MSAPGGPGPETAAPGSGESPEAATDYDRRRRRVLWSLPSGLYVIGSAATVDGQPLYNLMTANLVIQVAVEPKLVGVAVDATAVTAGLITAGRAFSVNLLPRTERNLVRRFVKPVTDVRVEDGAVVAMAGQPVLLAGGVPVLRDALAALVCQVRHRLDLGSHVLFVGEVLDVVGDVQGGDDREGPTGVLRMEDTRMSYGG